jgi:hypothetical protein
MTKFRKNDKVRIKYGKRPQKQVLTITESMLADGENYYFVKQRKCAIPERLLQLESKFVDLTKPK